MWSKILFATFTFKEFYFFMGCEGAWHRWKKRLGKNARIRRIIQRIFLFFQMTKVSLILLTLFSSVFADQPGYGAPPAAPPQVKYGGPIVYTGEKPPIIHFPPPPEKVIIIF
jgi:hypothetical protein